jgi:hypothetical protein
MTARFLSSGFLDADGDRRVAHPDRSVKVAGLAYGRQPLAAIIGKGESMLADLGCEEMGDPPPISFSGSKCFVLLGLRATLAFKYRKTKGLQVCIGK